MKEILLKTESLSKSFSSGGVLQHVLKNIDLQLYKGDFTVIMGASGAGKSTLLYALSGMDTPSLGRITFDGEVISDYSSDELAVFRRKSCGFVFQQIYLIDGMSVMDNVLAAGLLVNRDKKALVRRAEELFRAVDIPEAAWTKFPSQLSGGEAQRVGIVRGLINSPRILFADEPTGSVKLVQHYPKIIPVTFPALSTFISSMADRQRVRFSSRDRVLYIALKSAVKYFLTAAKSGGASCAGSGSCPSAAVYIS